MVPIYEVSNAELSALRCERIAQEVGAESYTELWLTPDGKRIIKLFAEEDTTRGFFDEDIKNDTSTLIALSSVSHCFDDWFVLPKNDLPTAISDNLLFQAIYLWQDIEPSKASLDGRLQKN